MSEEAFQEAITAFVARLQELGDPDLYDLRPGASETQIAAADEILSIELPPSFKAFLSVHNGGSAWETSIYGVGCDDEDEEHFDLALPADVLRD